MSFHENLHGPGSMAERMRCIGLSSDTSTRNECFSKYLHTVIGQAILENRWRVGRDMKGDNRYHGLVLVNAKCVCYTVILLHGFEPMTWKFMTNHISGFTY